MIADEADQDGSKEYLVYAGVFFPLESVQSLSDEVASLLADNEFPSEHDLKFSAGSSPKGYPSSKHTAIKNGVLSSAAKHGCKICCYVVPHAIAKGQPHENRLKFGVNTLLSKFDQFMFEQKIDGGVALFDQSQDYKQKAYLKEAFKLGVLSEQANTRKKLNRVVHIDNTAIGHSHLTSITDVITGAIRFVVNEPDKDQVGPILLNALVDIMWSTPEGGDVNVRERGICIRPIEIKSKAIKADVDALISRLEQWSKP